MYLLNCFLKKLFNSTKYSQCGFKIQNEETSGRIPIIRHVKRKGKGEIDLVKVICSMTNFLCKRRNFHFNADPNKFWIFV